MRVQGHDALAQAHAAHRRRVPAAGRQQLLDARRRGARVAAGGLQQLSVQLGGALGRRGRGRRLLGRHLLVQRQPLDVVGGRRHGAAHLHQGGHASLKPPPWPVRCRAQVSGAPQEMRARRARQGAGGGGAGRQGARAHQQLDAAGRGLGRSHRVRCKGRVWGRTALGGAPNMSAANFACEAECTARPCCAAPATNEPCRTQCTCCKAPNPPPRVEAKGLAGCRQALGRWVQAAANAPLRKGPSEARRPTLFRRRHPPPHDRRSLVVLDARGLMCCRLLRAWPQFCA